MWQHNADKSVQNTVHIARRCSVAVFDDGNGVLRGGTLDTLSLKQLSFGNEFEVDVERLLTSSGIGNGSSDSDHGKSAAAITMTPLPASAAALATTHAPRMARMPEWLQAQKIDQSQRSRLGTETDNKRNQYQYQSFNQLNNSIIGGRFHAPGGISVTGSSRKRRSAVS